MRKNIFLVCSAMMGSIALGVALGFYFRRTQEKPAVKTSLGEVTDASTQRPETNNWERTVPSQSSGKASTWDAAYTAFLFDALSETMETYRDENGGYLPKPYQEAALFYYNDDDIPELLHLRNSGAVELYTYDTKASDWEDDVRMITEIEPSSYGLPSFLPRRSAYSIVQQRGSFSCVQLVTDKGPNYEYMEKTDVLFPHREAFGGDIPAQPGDTFYKQFSVIKDTTQIDTQAVNDELSAEWVPWHDIVTYALEQGYNNAIPFLWQQLDGTTSTIQ